MSGISDRLRDFYQQELAALREEAGEFGQDHPEQAGMLGIQRGRSQDPQVELMMQSFAYLPGRLRYQLEVDQALLPNALLADLYPHLAAPLPSMTVAHLEAHPDGVGTIERGRSVIAQVPAEGGGTLAASAPVSRPGCGRCRWPMWPSFRRRIIRNSPATPKSAACCGCACASTGARSCGNCSRKVCVSI
jgi:hypothetical protein